VKLLKSYLYRIYLTSIQKKKFGELYAKNVFLFNELVDEKKKRIVNHEDEAIYVKDFVARFEELNNGNLVSYISTYKQVNRLFSKFKETELDMAHKNPNKLPRKIHFDIHLNNIKWDKNHLFIPRLGNFHARIHREIPQNSEILSAIIEEHNHNEFYINLLVERDVMIKKVFPKRAVGLDYSSPRLFYSSESEVGDSYKVVNFHQNKINRIKRMMSKCILNSANYTKLKDKEEKLYDHVTRKRCLSLQRAANECLAKYDVVGVETLDMTEIASHYHLGKNTYLNSYSRFLKYLEYKAFEKGKYFIKVPKYFPSSRLCSHCGLIKEKLELSERVYKCDCGLQIDRDLNAAINIKEKALEMLEEKFKKTKLIKTM
jgi:Transposase and inactivated derivatives